MLDRYEQDRERYGRDRGFENERSREGWRGNQWNQEFQGGPGFEGRQGYQGGGMDFEGREGYRGNQGYQNSGNDDRDWRSGNRGEYMQQGFRGRSFHHDFRRGNDLNQQNYNAMGGPSQGGQWDDQSDWSSRRGQGIDSGRYAAGGSYYGGTGDFGGGMSQYGEQGRYAGRGPRGYKRSDDRIKEDVNERLTQDPWVDAVEIEVQVKDGEVTLTGSVNSRDEKRRAEDAIDRVSGIREVHNQLRVQHQHEGAMAGQGQAAAAGQSSSTQQTSRSSHSGQQTTAARS